LTKFILLDKSKLFYVLKKGEIKMKTNYHYNNSDQVLQLVNNFFIKEKINMKLTSEQGFGKYVFEDSFNEIFPNIIFSDEIPLILKKYPYLDVYPIDKLMGIYSPQTKSITIYIQGIEKAKQKLFEVLPELTQKKENNLYADLIKIVILHELGHYLFHNMDFKEVIWKADAPQPFAPIFINESVDEWVAQSFAYNCVKDVSELESILLQLTEIQPLPYKSFLNIELQESWARYISYLQYFDKTVKPILVNEEKTQFNDINVILDATNLKINMDKYIV